jgi:hypothetical protein
LTEASEGIKEEQNDSGSLVDHVRKELLMYNHLDLHSKKNLKKRWWTAEEDHKLNDLVKKFGVRDRLIAGQELEEDRLVLQGKV